MEVFPSWVRRLWDKWQLRILVLSSLFLQIILTLFGKRRKSSSSRWFIFLVWSAYLLADWVATIALGVLFNSKTDSESNHLNEELFVFWSPFLMLHLAGSDTITAFSLEDNELWLRHLFGLIVQVGGMAYVFLKSLPGTRLSILTILMFMIGIIKYGERIFAFRYASREKLRDSMLPAPDPGPSYAKFMEKYSSIRAKGQHWNQIFIPEAPYFYPAPHGSQINKIVSDESIVLDAYCFFRFFKRLFVDLILSFHDEENSVRYFSCRSWKEAFEVIEAELGFMFDVLFTKAPIFNTLTGCILYFISFFSAITVFVVFTIIKKHGYSEIDLIIAYVLFVGTIVLQIYSFLMLLSSEWTIVWFGKKRRNARLKSLIFRFISLMGFNPAKRWSNSMAQCNLISFCLKYKPTLLPRVQKYFGIDRVLHKYRCKSYMVVIDDLKEQIFKQLKVMARTYSEDKELHHYKGEWVLKMANCFVEFKWSIEVEFDRSFLLWHIATDLCYYSSNCDTELSEEIKSKRKISKQISDYMLYLLLMCPFMLPTGIGEIRFRDTCAEAKNFLEEKKCTSSEIEACMMLLSVSTEIEPSDIKGDRSKSLLFNGCRLAKQLSLGGEQKWELTSRVWVEMLSYASIQCKGNYHAQQLSVGGELLTHVWLLMAHLGISKQFQISKGQHRREITNLAL